MGPQLLGVYAGTRCREGPRRSPSHHDAGDRRSPLRDLRGHSVELTPPRVGWVERIETHHQGDLLHNSWWVRFALNPPYELNAAIPSRAARRDTPANWPHNRG